MAPALHTPVRAPAMRTVIAATFALLALLPTGSARAGCGCDKPPPPRAAVRPFVGYQDLRISLIDPRLVPGQRYAVEFVSAADGRGDFSRGRARLQRDLADREVRTHLRVPVPPVALGPCTLKVWDDTGRFLFALPPDAFTVVARPLPLHEFDETVTHDGYRAGVGADGTVYVPVDVSQVSAATTFTGAAQGFPLEFTAEGVAMYNPQGFLMQLLDARMAGLFAITPPGDGATSEGLGYWRHEFASYKQMHRRLDTFQTDDDPDWHADGSYHVDHDVIVIAVHGTLADGSLPAPGATPPFRLVVTSSPRALD